MHDGKFTMNDVDVDVIIDRRIAYGLADGKPFRARLGSTSSFLGHGKSVWDVSDGFTAPEKRIIARALWKALGDESSIRVSKRWTKKDSWGFKVIKDVTVDLPGRK
jgi:hypothetical protein